MADIRPGNKIEKSIVNLEGFKEKVNQSVEKERIKRLEQARKEIVENIANAEKMAPATTVPATGILAPQSVQQKKIEKVLSSGLESIYLNLTPEKKKEFKRVGEETAAKINMLLEKTKINVGKIIKLIRKWLSIIPGVNKYFLDQEAKIKADEILRMKHE